MANSPRVRRLTEHWEVRKLYVCQESFGESTIKNNQTMSSEDLDLDGFMSGTNKAGVF